MASDTLLILEMILLGHDHRLILPTFNSYILGLFLVGIMHSIISISEII